MIVTDRVQYALDVRTARAAATIAAIGPSPILELREGMTPVSCAMPASGAILARAPLPLRWAIATDGELAQVGDWALLSVAVGTLNSFRLYTAAAPARCVLQGRITMSGHGGGAMQVSSMRVEKIGQLIQVTGFAIRGGNA